MKYLWAQFVFAEDGAATLDWALLAASLTTLLVVSVLTATGSLAYPDPSAPAAPADAAITLPAPDGLGS